MALQRVIYDCPDPGPGSAEPMQAGHFAAQMLMIDRADRIDYRRTVSPNNRAEISVVEALRRR